MRFLVYGAGPIGSICAAKLHEAGRNVSVLARGERLSDIREHGIVLEDFDTGHRTRSQVFVVEQLRPEDVYDLVLVVMGKNKIKGVLPSLALNRHTPNVLFVGNNAAGPDEMVQALGRERVLLGFPLMSGALDGYVVRYRTGPKGPKILMGELDGSISQRIKRIAEELNSAGFSISISPDMDAWLKYHAAVIIPLAGGWRMAGGDIRKLARMRDGVRFILKAIREGFEVLDELGIHMTPRKLHLIKWVPEWILVPYMQRLLNTKRAADAFAHGRAARDGVKLFADEFLVLARRTSVQTPALDQLCKYLTA